MGKALEALLSDPSFGYRIDLTDKVKIKSMSEKKAAERESRAKKLAEARGTIVPVAGKTGSCKGKAKGIGKNSKGMATQHAMYEQMAYDMAMANPMQMMTMMRMMN